MFLLDPFGDVVGGIFCSVFILIIEAGLNTASNEGGQINPRRIFLVDEQGFDVVACCKNILARNRRMKGLSCVLRKLPFQLSSITEANMGSLAYTTQSSCMFLVSTHQQAGG